MGENKEDEEREKKNRQANNNNSCTVYVVRCVEMNVPLRNKQMFWN